ncbi:MAG TPA: ATPase, T2SS/T4P/T4SS family [Candidatus Saccharimonadales bacterium]|nr:ATPase, T2SS/T4P/T4SS family [Candidatus Saccharimonadales bacterium]
MDDNGGTVTENNPVAEACDRLLTDAAQTGATTVHLEPLEDLAQVRHRVDGLLREYGKISHRALSALTDHLKELARLTPDERQRPQEGSFRFEVDGHTFNISIATMPVAYGEKTVLQLHDLSTSIVGFEALGLWGTTKKELDRLVSVHDGLLVVTGPHQAGTTTTLRNIGAILAHPTTHVTSIESQPIAPIKGVSQFIAKPIQGLRLVDGIKAATNGDAHVLLVSELSTIPSMEASLEAVLKGRLVVSSMHQTGLPSALKHLRTLSDETHLLAHTLRGVVSQRLARRLCDSCKQTVHPDRETLKALTNAARVTLATLQHFLEETKTESRMGLYEASEHGCSECHYTGYKGRIGLFEVLPMTERLQGQLMAGTTERLMVEQAVRDGVIPLKVDGLIKALCGLTSIEEVVRVTGGS